MRFSNPVTVTVQRPTGYDDFGNPIFDGSTHTIDNCAHCPRDTTELLGTEDTLVTDEWLWGPVDADLKGQDRVWLPGDDTGKSAPWQVMGDVQSYRDHPFTTDPEASGFQAVLRKVT